MALALDEAPGGPGRPGLRPPLPVHVPRPPIRPGDSKARTMMDELIAALTRDAGLAPEQAALAAAAMLRFLTARLPSNLVGQLHERLDPPAQPAAVNPKPAGKGQDDSS